MGLSNAIAFIQQAIAEYITLHWYCDSGSSAYRQTPKSEAILSIILMWKIKRNAIKCNHCGEIIESTYRHDFKTCSCGRASVDGGHDYLRRCFIERGDYTDLSETEEIAGDPEG